MLTLPQTPSLRLDGKRALVTGASSGIGLACAVAVAEAGADVVAIARSADKLSGLEEAARAQGLSLTAQTLDVSDTESVGKSTYGAGENYFNPGYIEVNNGEDLLLYYGGAAFTHAGDADDNQHWKSSSSGLGAIIVKRDRFASINGGYIFNKKTIPNHKHDFIGHIYGIHVVSIPLSPLCIDSPT